MLLNHLRKSSSSSSSSTIIHHSSFTIHHSPYIIHHSSFIIITSITHQNWCVRTWGAVCATNFEDESSCFSLKLQFERPPCSQGPKTIEPYMWTRFDGKHLSKGSKCNKSIQLTPMRVFMRSKKNAMQFVLGVQQ